jgi:hypothetical protein
MDFTILGMELHNYRGELASSTSADKQREKFDCLIDSQTNDMTEF